MIKPQDLFNINFYKKNPFFGSYQGMHYRISKASKEDTDHLEVTIWPGPYNYETTPDEDKTSASFSFSNDGLKEICDYLNQYHAEHFHQN